METEIHVFKHWYKISYKYLVVTIQPEKSHEIFGALCTFNKAVLF